MKVIEVKPYGYCMGVTKAIALAKKAKKDNPERNVVLLGMLVHNEMTVESLIEAGLTLIDERKIDLEEALEGLNEGDVVIFSAHGHPRHYDEIAKRKGLIVYDATCPYVEENLAFALKEEDELIYVGAKGHLEAEGFHANCPKAAFYDVHSGSLEKEKLHDDHPAVVTQTTLSEEEILAAMAQIKKEYPAAHLEKSRCHATTSRQEAVKSLPEEVDCVIVLGSTSSNNSRKLHEIALGRKKDAYLCLDETSLANIDFSKYRVVALCSGASTSFETFVAAKRYLLSL